MGPKLDYKKWLLASVAVFLLLSVIEALIHRVLLYPAYPAVFPQAVEGGRDPNLLRFYGYTARAIYSLMFVYGFARRMDRGLPGVVEGLRYGLWTALLIPVPAFFVQLMITEFPFDALLLRGFTISIECVLCGILVNLIYKKKAPSQ